MPHTCLLYTSREQVIDWLEEQYQAMPKPEEDQEAGNWPQGN